ncbi:hypothetical protein JCM9140_3182 [Halalkalibacter wakoensis JCM 9140]|uniref:Uncharacterized protein n=1 Tax=Halalkalibacter wakoensis JCM 9140 TaxID=1236970 RepID=W4Q548_9BACI|nr:hypothetical protein [Halalkalibacter wakoensis]GAE27070.1 hypothetical protein JCM9140_3182 [Halalkalibacter wakoensis JCM 9140]
MSAYLLGIFFILIHLFSNTFIPADRIRRNKWLSFSGGLAVSYVFVYVLPSLHREQQAIEWYSDSLTMESELYFICLLGLLLFYRVQKTVKTTHKVETNQSAFWLYIGFFTLYNMLIVYVVMAANVSFIQAIFYGAAIGLHFIAVAHDLWRENPEQYNKRGRFFLALGIIAGWFIGMFLTLSTFIQAIIFAFISGAMILNVLQNELPKEKHAHFPSFAIGVFSYTTITIALKFFFEW